MNRNPVIEMASPVAGCGSQSPEVISGLPTKTSACGRRRPQGAVNRGYEQLFVIAQLVEQREVRAAVRWQSRVTFSKRMIIRHFPPMETNSRSEDRRIAVSSFVGNC
jgi:hypothetical protein